MKLYIKATSSFKGNLEEFDVKKELKQRYKRDTRRQDKFIHLALYGALRLKDKCEIIADDELYVTSGVGNMDIAQKANEQVKIKKEILRPFDFINMLGNTTSYYVASALGVKSKNIFQISNSFTFINTLISIYASLSISKKEAVLGSVDLVPTPDIIIKRVLGLDKNSKVLSAANYQKLSLNADDAIAVVEFDTKIYSLQEVNAVISKIGSKVVYLNRDEYFQTQASYYINQAIEQKESLLYVDCVENKYKIILVDIC